MKRIRGVLLDVDGTLVGSNDAHAHAWMDALRESGVSASFEQVRRRIGEGGDKLLPEVSGIDAESPKGKSIARRRQAIFLEKYLPTLRSCRGSADLLRTLAAGGFRLAVASSAKKEELDPLLRICGADRWIQAGTSSDDAERSKPDPDIVHSALGELKMAAGEVALLGDTPYDVEAGRRAGVVVIAVRCGGWNDRDLAADAIYDDPADLLANLDRSPLGTLPRS
jgi:phosphoglycolate phosphatase-like HAD superfamily hydrolase